MDPETSVRLVTVVQSGASRRQSPPQPYRRGTVVLGMCKKEKGAAAASLGRLLVPAFIATYPAFCI